VPAIASILRDSPKPIVGDKSSIARVRCVLMRDGRYLLAQHNSRHRERIGRWGLPGGRLRPPEKPKACLRRELLEELGVQVRIGPHLPGPLPGTTWPLGDRYEMLVWFVEVTEGERTIGVGTHERRVIPV